jgi:opacity protein-like surface antigen
MRKFFVLAALLVLVSGAALAQDHPKAEIFGGYSFLRVNPGSGVSGENVPAGWHASVAGNVNDWFGFAGDFSGHYKTISGVSGKAHTFTFGPRISYRKNEKVTPFAHAQFGGINASAAGFGLGASETAFAMNLGGGVDVKINDNFAFRVAQFDYLMTRFVSDSQHNFRISTGIVIRFN